MKRVARTFEYSLSVHSPSADQHIRDNRKQEIAGIQSDLERRVTSGIDAFTSKHYRAAKVVLSGMSRAIGGVNYIGNGMSSSVYKKGDEVLKVYRKTALMDGAAREEFRLQRETMCNSLKDHLGVIVAGQTLEIGEHPLGDYTVVIARQPFVPGKRLDLFATNTLELNREGITAYCERTPSGQPQLYELVERTFVSHDKSSLVPDLNGVDNFRLIGADEQLRLIDVEPISQSEHSSVHAHILEQAEVLAAFLEAA